MSERRICDESKIIAELERKLRIFKLKKMGYHIDDFLKTPIRAIDDFIKTSNSRTDFENLKDLDPDYIPNQKKATGSMVSINRYERWFGLRRNCVGGYEGIKEIEINPSSKFVSHGSNHRNSSKGKPIGEMDIDGYDILIQVIHGAFSKNHRSYGKSITIYKNN